MTVLAPAIPAQVSPSRQVAVTVAGATVVVPCPLWCTHPHSEAYRSLPDVSHHGAPITLAAPTYGGVEQTLTARISSWPFASDPETATPFIAFDAIGDECAQLAPTAALAVADQVIAHGYALRALASSVTA
ncbi:DUF6907 domain-containing protein [Streptomyces decoyicus]|uniref:DUF6907 domain-containing protein n=1 Tax=Streptomyces decoyicus TaxID=249567 RepID=UPI0033B7F027